MELQWSRSHLFKTEPKLRQWPGRTCVEISKEIPKEWQGLSYIILSNETLPLRQAGVGGGLWWNVANLMESESSLKQEWVKWSLSNLTIGTSRFSQYLKLFMKEKSNKLAEQWKIKLNRASNPGVCLILRNRIFLIERVF